MFAELTITRWHETMRQVHPVNVEFGAKVRRARENRRISQDSLARLLGLSRTSVTNIEAGRHGVSLHVVYDLAEALGLQVTDLLPPATERGRTELEKVLDGMSDAEVEVVRTVIKARRRRKE